MINRSLSLITLLRKTVYNFTYFHSNVSSPFSFLNPKNCSGYNFTQFPELWTSLKSLSKRLAKRFTARLCVRSLLKNPSLYLYLAASATAEQNKVCLFYLTAAVIYFTVKENHFPALFSRYGIGDEKWVMTKTIIFRTNMTVCMPQMWLHTAENTSQSYEIQLINWTWL
jgi:hypothetical protein